MLKFVFFGVENALMGEIRRNINASNSNSKSSLMWFLGPQGLIICRQPVIIAVTVRARTLDQGPCSVHQKQTIKGV